MSTPTPIRFDKFAIGDRVVWSDDYHADLLNSRDRYGDGPFVVARVEDATYASNETPTQHRWEAMGHIQYVEIEGHANKYSGAFFRRVKPPARRSSTNNQTTSADRRSA